MTALATITDLKGGWADLIDKSIQIKGLANKSGFITPPYWVVCGCRNSAGGLGSQSKQRTGNHDIIQ